MQMTVLCLIVICAIFSFTLETLNSQPDSHRQFSSSLHSPFSTGSYPLPSHQDPSPNFYSDTQVVSAIL